MDLPHYPFVVNDNRLAYSFYSLGPRGVIHKIIRYTRLETEGHVVFNLSLGDVDSETKQIREDVVSGNDDMDRIFRTVAETTALVCEDYPRAYIQIRGNSQSRNRLYRIVVSRHLEQIRLQYDVYGLVGVEWEVFREGQGYEGFLLHSRK